VSAKYEGYLKNSVRIYYYILPLIYLSFSLYPPSPSSVNSSATKQPAPNQPNLSLHDLILLIHVVVFSFDSLVLVSRAIGCAALHSRNRQGCA